MRIIITLTLFAFLALSPENSWAEKIYRVVVFGDSLTSGYQLQQQDAFPARLEQRLRAAGYEKIEVINMSKPNASTASATADVDLVVQKLPDVVVIELGFNDTKRGVVSSAIANNLNNMVETFKRAGAYVVLMGIEPPAAMGEDYTREVTSYFASVASARGIALYPSTLEGILNNYALTLADGIHPNSAGVDVMVEGVLPIVDVGLRWRYEVYLHEAEQAERIRRAGVAVPQP